MNLLAGNWSKPIVRISALLKSIQALFHSRLATLQQSQGSARAIADQRGLSFTDHVEAIAAEHEWLRAEKRKSRKKLPLSPLRGTSEPVPLGEYANYVECFVDWLDNIGEARAQSADEIVALARMFEAWSGWGNARPAELFLALKQAGIKTRRVNLKRDDPRYAAAKQKDVRAKPHMVIYDLQQPSAANGPLKLAA